MRAKKYVPCDPTEDTDLVLDSGEFGFIYTEAKELCPQTKKKTSSKKHKGSRPKTDEQHMDIP